MSSFLEIPVETYPEQIEQALYDQLAEAFPGWEPSEGNLEVWIAKWGAGFMAEVAELLADVSGDVFQRWGEQILAVPALLAVAAHTTATFTLTDDAGYTVPTGTQFEIEVTGSDRIGFWTTSDLVVAPGSTSGSTLVEAVTEGTAANGADGSGQMIDALAFVDSVALDDPATGGVDAETEDEYRDRLIGEAAVLSRSPILPADVAAVVQRHPAVGRAVAIDNYDPGPPINATAERSVTVAVTDPAGEPLSSGAKAEVDVLLEGTREVNFQFFVIDATYTTVPVTAAVKAYPGQSLAQVEEAAEQVVSSWLSPTNWGLAEGPSPQEWFNRTVVRRNDLIALLDGVPGVDYVVSLTAPASDVNLTGAAPLTRPGAIAVTVT